MAEGSGGLAEGTESDRLKWERACVKDGQNRRGD